LSSKVACHREVARDLAAIDFQNKSFESRIVRQLTTEVIEGLWIVEKRDWQVDRQIQRALLG